MASTPRHDRPDRTRPNSGTDRPIASPAALGRGLLLAAAASLVIAVIGLSPSGAAASEGDASLWVAAEAANASDTTAEGPQFGVGTQVGVSFDISDFWTLNVGSEAAFHPGVSPGDEKIPSLFVHNVFGGFRYNLDIFTYVPYAKLSAVAYTRSPTFDAAGTQRPAVGAKLTVGVNWRFDRHWSMGGMAELHTVQFNFEDFPSYSTVGFRLTHHFRL